MNPILKRDLDEVPAILEAVCKEAQNILASIGSRPAAVGPHAIEMVGLPESGSGFQGAFDEFQSRYAPGFSGSGGPRYWGFVTGGTTPAALAADWLVSTYDQNPTSKLDSSAPQLEHETISMLREMFGLSERHTGAFVTGATMSNVVGLALGREWIGNHYGIRVCEEGVSRLPPLRILSGAPHSSIYKALSILGMGRLSVEKMPLLPGREAIDMRMLEAHLQILNNEPCIVVANAGTVNTVDFDDLHALVKLKRQYSFWLHVDAAFGAFAALSPFYAHLVDGLDGADSICIDAHKWLNVPYDSAIQFTRHRDLQVRVFQNSAAYLGLPGDDPDFVHLTPENSRRLRALPAWFSLRAYGRAGHREIVERNCAMAQLLGGKIAQSEEFRLLAPVRLNVVCFTLMAEPSEQAINQLVERLRDTGTVFLTSTNYKGSWGLRAAFSNWSTQEADVESAWAALCRVSSAS